MPTIKLRRSVFQLRQIDIQKQTGIPMSRYSLIENSLVKASPREINKICAVLHTHPEDIFDSEGSGK